MERVAILGLGLMGGSLGLALKRSGFNGRVAAYARREETRKAALEEGVADEVFAEPAEAVTGADLVVLCVPVLSTAELLERCAPGLQPGCLVTDVGSTKFALAEHLPPLLEATSATFIGSHPVAGSEKRGLEAARGDLYDGSVVVVTPTPLLGDDDTVETLSSFWRSLGASVYVMDAALHDAVLARTSHLPHMVAALLAATVARKNDSGEVGRFCGTGFQDSTRIADGSPELWHDISFSNSALLIREIEAFRERADDLLKWLRAGDFEQVKTFLQASREARRALLEIRRASQEDVS